MSYVDDLGTAQHSIFRGRVRMAAVKAAVAVANEGPSGDERRDSLRGNLATNVLADPAGYEERFVWAVLTNSAVAAAGIAAPDGDLDYVMTTVWDALAGL
jgi:hypothetical protein